MQNNLSQNNLYILLLLLAIAIYLKQKYNNNMGNSEKIRWILNSIRTTQAVRYWTKLSLERPMTGKRRRAVKIYELDACATKMLYSRFSFAHYLHALLNIVRIVRNIVVRTRIRSAMRSFVCGFNVMVRIKLSLCARAHTIRKKITLFKFTRGPRASEGHF